MEYTSISALVAFLFGIAATLMVQKMWSSGDNPIKRWLNKRKD